MREAPSIAETSEGLVSRLDTIFGTSMPKGFTRVLSKTMAGLYVTLYKYGGYMTLQMFVSKASMRPTIINGKEVVPLVEWGRLIGAGDPNPPTQAELSITVAPEILGSAVPIGAQLVSVQNGVTYITTESHILDAATKAIRVVASSDQSGGTGSGLIGNLPVGSVVSFASPLSGVKRDAVVSNSIITGVEGETETEYRRRVEDRFKRRPQGGAYVDYKSWAETAAGTAKAFPYTSKFPGQVDVYIQSSTEVNGVPTNDQLVEALAAINFNNANGLAERRPINALPNTLAIKPQPFKVQILGLVVENEPNVRAEILATLTEFFRSREPFLVGLTIPPRLDRISQSAVSGMVDDIVNRANGIFSDIKVFKAGSQTLSYTLGEGETSYLSEVEYT